MQATNQIPNSKDSAVERLQQRLAWLRRDPGNSSLYRQCADDATALRQYDVLLEIADQASSRNPADAAPLFDRANARIGLRDYQGALTTLAGIQPESDDQQRAIAANQAICHYCLGEYEQSLPLLMSEYRRGRRDADSLFMLVRSSHYLGKLDEAVAIANENAAAASQNAALAGAYALMFLDAEDAGNAARWSATALRLDPRSVDGAVTDGTLAVMRLQIERAQRHFNAVIETAPDTGRAWIGLGTLAMLQQDLGHAALHFERALQSMPTYVGGWHMLGWVQLMQQELAAAQRSLDHALTLDRNFAETHGALAVLDAMKNDTASAKHRLEIAQRLDPNGFSAQFAMALLADPTLQGTRSREIMQQTLTRIAGGNDSALGKLLLRPRQ